MEMIKDFFTRILICISIVIILVSAALEIIIELPVFCFVFIFFAKDFDLLFLTAKLDQKLGELKWQ